MWADLSICSDTPIRTLVDHLRGAFRCKTVHLYNQLTGGSPLDPADTITKENASIPQSWVLYYDYD